MVGSFVTLAANSIACSAVPNSGDSICDSPILRTRTRLAIAGQYSTSSFPAPSHICQTRELWFAFTVKPSRPQALGEFV